MGPLLYIQSYIHISLAMCIVYKNKKIKNPVCNALRDLYCVYAIFLHVYDNGEPWSRVSSRGLQ